jgi:hypothetical protein
MRRVDSFIAYGVPLFFYPHGPTLPRHGRSVNWPCDTFSTVLYTYYTLQLGINSGATVNYTVTP